MKYKFDIIYSKRKSISITVSTDNRITVRCPFGVSEVRVQKFLAEKSDWIDKIVKKNECKLNINSDVLSFEKIYVGGVKYPLITGSRKSEFAGDGVFVKSLKDIKKLYIASFSENFIFRVAEVANSTGFKFLSVKVRDYKSRWGCCDSKNNLSFNYKLFMLPDYIVYYVIIHELSHTVQHNHSEKFWRLVEKFVPNYRKLKKELRCFDFITTLY